MGHLEIDWTTDPIEVMCDGLPYLFPVGTTYDAIIDYLRLMGHTIGLITWTNPMDVLSPDASKKLCMDIDNSGNIRMKVNDIESFELIEQLRWGITSGISGATTTGGVWSGWIFDATTSSYLYIQPLKVTQRMVDAKDDLYLLVYYYIYNTGSGNIYFNLTYGRKALGEVLGLDFDPYVAIPADAVDNYKLKVWQYKLDPSVFEAGKMLALTIGRDGANVLDTYPGSMVVMSAFIVKI